MGKPLSAALVAAVHRVFTQADRTDPKPDAAAVERYVQLAAIDFRDVLLWAEYSPERIDYQSAVRTLGLESRTV